MNPSRPQKGGSSPSGAGLPLEAFFADSEALDADGFAAKHGTGFLLVTASNILAGESTSTRVFLEGVDDNPGDHTADLAVVVYRLRPKQGPAGGHLVTIGRDSRHDAVVPDPSVSRFHCIAKREADGTWCLQDMSSSNGTTINGRSVPARGAGDPVPVKPGDTVGVGQVQFTFTDAVALRDFAHQAAR